jgi:hypothetical protein
MLEAGEHRHGIEIIGCDKQSLNYKLLAKNSPLNEGKTLLGQLQAVDSNELISLRVSISTYEEGPPENLPSFFFMSNIISLCRFFRPFTSIHITRKNHRLSSLIFLLIDVISQVIFVDILSSL